MTNHTPEPWAVWRLAPDSDPEERFIVVGPDGENEITSVVYSDADARRIVACVNALSGFTLPQIEAIAQALRHGIVVDGKPAQEETIEGNEQGERE